jgi:hypothetical protein
MAKYPPEIAATVVTFTRTDGVLLAEATFRGQTYEARSYRTKNTTEVFDDLGRSIRNWLLLEAGYPVVRKGPDDKFGFYRKRDDGTLELVSLEEFEAERATWVASP